MHEQVNMNAKTNSSTKLELLPIATPDRLKFAQLVEEAYEQGYAPYIDPRVDAHYDRTRGCWDLMYTYTLARRSSVNNPLVGCKVRSIATATATEFKRQFEEAIQDGYEPGIPAMAHTAYDESRGGWRTFYTATLVLPPKNSINTNTHGRNRGTGHGGCDAHAAHGKNTKDVDDRDLHYASGRPMSMYQ